MNSLWDIRIFLGLVPKESLCIWLQTVNSLEFAVIRSAFGQEADIFGTRCSSGQFRYTF
jgi:hypothetical protein